VVHGFMTALSGSQSKPPALPEVGDSAALIDLGYFFILWNAVNASAALFSFI
jgi:hypothetical protein